MDISCPAASVRVDACSRRCITLVGLPPDEALHISLLAEILGWHVHLVSFERSHAARSTEMATWDAVQHDAVEDVAVQQIAGSTEPTDVAVSGPCLGLPSAAAVLDRAVAVEDHAGRSGASGLVLHMVGRVIRVECDDVVIRRQLAVLGLDRLVPPVPLHALEQLLVFAG
ncbi:MAG: hypothetical protein RIS17_879 [Pseudomonadota bacterium]